MLSYCLKCRKNTECNKPKVLKTKGKIMPSWKCEVNSNKKLRFLKEQEASGMLSSLGL